MKIYLAGIYTSNFDLGGRIYARLTDAEKKHREEVKFILESYHYIHKPSYVNKIRKDGVKVFLDSGAFSAFTKGVDVDIQGYCRYIQENMDIIEVIDGNVCASVLDSIGNAQGTYENQIQMEALGVRPLPCFHYGEDERWLEWYLSKYDHITIGGMVPISTPQLIHWLDRIWDKYLTDGAGNPRLKVHGFGVTTLPLIERYPWYSVDSSSWVQKAAMGSILLPTGKSLTVSDSSPARKVKGQHFDNLTLPEQEALASMLIGKGYEVERLRTEYISRWAFNCSTYPSMSGKEVDAAPSFIPEQKKLF